MAVNEVAKTVLREYCMIENMIDARKYVNRNFGCSGVRKEKFLIEVQDVFSNEYGVLSNLDYDSIQDYIDSLRRCHHQGIGL